MPRRDEEQESQRMALYREGKSDAEIARALGLKKNTAIVWRRSRGLPRNFDPKAPRVSTDESAKRMLFYQLGWSDHHIARELRIGRNSIWHWRRIHKLPGNFGHGHNERYSDRRPTMGDLHERIRRAVGRSLPPDIIDDTVSDLCLAVLDGTLSLAEIEKQARKFGNRTLDRYASKFGPRSLDEKIGEDDFTLMDTLVDDSASSWLEEMGATVW